MKKGVGLRITEFTDHICNMFYVHIKTIHSTFFGQIVPNFGLQRIGLRRFHQLYMVNMYVRMCKCMNGTGVADPYLGKYTYFEFL